MEIEERVIYKFVLPLKVTTVFFQNNICQIKIRRKQKLSLLHLRLIKHEYFGFKPIDCWWRGVCFNYFKYARILGMRNNARPLSPNGKISWLKLRIELFPLRQKYQVAVFPNIWLFSSFNFLVCHINYRQALLLSTIRSRRHVRIHDTVACEIELNWIKCWTKHNLAYRLE